MSVYFKLTVSDPCNQEWKNLPITLKAKFRSWRSVVEAARKNHNETRTVVITTHSNDRFIDSIEILGREGFPF